MRVYLGIPIYGGADALFISSLLKTRVVLQVMGYETEVDLHSGCSILPKARNEIVKRFLDSGFDVLLFIDADMAWNPVDAIRLLQSTHQVTAGVYRVKDEAERYNYMEKGGKIEGVGTGFLALKREALLQMVNAYPQTHYTDKGKDYHALFDFELHDGRYWGEDYTFCRRWRAIGGKITVFPDIVLTHIGNKNYSGSLEKHLEKQ